MPKKKHTWLLFLLLSAGNGICNLAEGETLRVTTTLYEKPGNNSLCELKAGTRIEALPVQKHWIPVVVYVWMPDSCITGDDVIRAKSPLFDSLGTPIGRMLSQATWPRYSANLAAGWYGELLGFIPEGTIEPYSIPEVSLEKIVSAYPKTFHFQELSDYLDTTGFIPWLGEGKFSSYLLYENRVNTRHPGPRLICIFSGDMLVALVYSRNIKVPYYESKAESAPYKIYYMMKMTESEKSTLAKAYFHAFKTVYR